jgi:crotonobetainyl-CoA:carnitine CoA-transferase CaiB-like acyl-CoA transferase
MSGPLEGVRVVDLTHHLGGPLAAMFMAQLGADVIKIEQPGGDEWRAVDEVGGESRLFHSVNRDKRGIVLDLKTEEGAAALARLLEDADVLVHSLSPGVAERLGFGAAEITERHPRLVYCALSAFGPDRGRGSDIAVQAESGLITANEGRIVPVPVHDTLVPWIMVSGILAALFERERSGRGQVVETSLLEAAGALSVHRLIRDDSGEPLFNRFVGALYRTYPTSDGTIAIACYAPRLQEPLLRTIGLGELLEDPRFADVAGRARNGDALDAKLRALLRTRTSDEWHHLIEEAGLPHGVVAEEPLSLLDHPQAHALGLVVEIEDPSTGTESVVGPPLRLSRTPAATRRPAPRLGEHTDEVLGGEPWV